MTAESLCDYCKHTYNEQSLYSSSWTYRLGVLGISMGFMAWYTVLVSNGNKSLLMATVKAIPAWILSTSVFLNKKGIQEIDS